MVIFNEERKRDERIRQKNSRERRKQGGNKKKDTGETYEGWEDKKYKAQESEIADIRMSKKEGTM